MMKTARIMDRCLECIGLPKLRDGRAAEHLQCLGKGRLGDGSQVTCYACTTCGLRWLHDESNGWRAASALDPTKEAKRAMSLARFADSVVRS